MQNCVDADPCLPHDAQPTPPDSWFFSFIASRSGAAIVGVVAAAAATDDNSAGDSDHDDSRDDAGIGSGGET